MNNYLKFYNNLVKLTRNKVLYENFNDKDEFSDRLIFLLIHLSFFFKVFKSEENNKLLQIQYGNYQKIKEQLLPKKIVIKALENKDNCTVIDIEFKSLVLNKQITTPFRIPSGYKSIKF